MSHRVTTQTEIKDKALAAKAIKDAGMTYVEDSDTLLRITSGPMVEATIDLKTGLVTGDTDYHHSRESLGMLKQLYGEAKYRKECAIQGIMIDERTVEKNGDIVLMCSMG